MLGAQIGCWVCHCLDLDEAAQVADLIEVYANSVPEQQPPGLLHDDQHTQRIAEGVLQPGRVADRHQPVAALARHRIVGALVGDEMRGGVLLA
jgi:hypothetical protein